MSDDMKNPYNSPANVYDTPGFTERPKGVMAIGVIGIILGGMNALAAFGGMIGFAVNVFFKEFFQKLMIPNMNPAPGSHEEVQLKMQLAMQAVGEKYLVAQFLLAILAAVVAYMLIRGGIGAIRQVPSARKLFIYGMAVGIIQEILNGVATTMVQMETFGIMKTMAESLTANNQPGAEAAQMVIMGSMMLGVVMAVIWIVLKLVYFGIGLKILNKPSTVEYYGS
jgi:hypothetical protein